MTLAKNSHAHLKLQPPGNGLPFLEALIVRYYYGMFVSKKVAPEQSYKNIHLYTHKILQTIKDLSTLHLEQKILIPKLPGMEDSSRYWSIHMTLEHLVIVGKSMKHVITELSKGHAISVKVDIAKVKPLGEMSSQEAITEFETFFSTLPEDLQKQVGDIDSPTRLYHPWLGSSTARQWLWLFASHQGIHYNQIKNIKKLL